MKLDYEVGHAFTFSRRDTLDFRLHAQGEVEIAFMLCGSCRISCGNMSSEIRAGDVFIAFPNQPHKYEESNELEAYLLIIPVKPYLSVYYNTLMKQVPVHPVLKKGEWDASLLQLLELALRDHEKASEPVMQGYLMVTFGKLLASLQLQEQKTGAEEVLRRVLGYLHDHYRESVSRRDIAKAVGYNESYVSHLFSQTMGITLPEYIHSLRIDDACRLLLETDATVADLASELGFASIRNFNRVFLKQTGVTPRQYRNSAKK